MLTLAKSTTAFRRNLLYSRIAVAAFLGGIAMASSSLRADVRCINETICFEDPCYPDGDIGCDSPDPSDPMPIYTLQHSQSNPYTVSCLSSTSHTKLLSAGYDIMAYFRARGYGDDPWTYPNFEIYPMGAAFNVRYSDGSVWQYMFHYILRPGDWNPVWNSNPLISSTPIPLVALGTDVNGYGIASYPVTSSQMASWYPSRPISTYCVVP